jgi:hypothetical protein
MLLLVTNYILAHNGQEFVEKIKVCSLLLLNISTIYKSKITLRLKF